MIRSRTCLTGRSGESRLKLRLNLIPNPINPTVAIVLIPLDMLKAGDWAEIAEVSGEAAWVGRLHELGVREGCRLQMIRSGSPCLLQIADCKLCLRGSDCTQILVRPIPA